MAWIKLTEAYTGKKVTLGSNSILRVDQRRNDTHLQVRMAGVNAKHLTCSVYVKESAEEVNRLIEDNR